MLLTSTSIVNVATIIIINRTTFNITEVSRDNIHFIFILYNREWIEMRNTVTHIQIRRSIKNLDLIMFNYQFKRKNK